TWLTMYGFVVDAVVCNRILPEDALGGYFAPWAASQSAGVQRVEESFAHLPVHKLPLQASEIEGLGALRNLAETLCGDADPAAINYRGEVIRVTRDGETLRLHVKLPEADRADLELLQDGNDLLLSYRSEHRRVALPDAVARHDVTGARYADGELVLTLSAPTDGAN
ncbi:MAG: ArsA-related P-loop ATPase, partial [Propionibacteriaceae bacterium]|nr:ArsA-related P-loop ATPase [Propionibacteriaceae bacterium]